MIDPSEWQVLMPHIGPKWNLEEHFATLGEVRVPFLLVDNSPTSDTKSMTVPAGIECVHYPDNMGIAGSWNLGIARGRRFNVIMSVSARFAHGLMRWIEQAARWTNDYGLDTPPGFHCMVIGKATFDLVGNFDENIFPAYMEDTDWYYRRDRHPLLKDNVRPVLRSPDLSFIRAAVAIGSGFPADQCVPEREAYYAAKWGGLPGHEKFLHPFNNETKPMSWWPPRVPGGGGKRQGWVLP